MTGFTAASHHIYRRTRDSSLTLRRDGTSTFIVTSRFINTGHSTILEVQGNREIIESQGIKSPKEGQMRIYNQGLLDPRGFPPTADHFFIPFIFAQRAKEVNVLVRGQTWRGDT